MVSPARRRAAAAEYLVRRHGISERRACLLVGLDGFVPSHPRRESDGLQENQIVAASTERRSSDYRSDCFSLSLDYESMDFPRICWGERIRTSDWLIQNQLPLRAENTRLFTTTGTTDFSATTAPMSMKSRSDSAI